MARPAPAQLAEREPVAVFGPEPIGAAQGRAIITQYLNDASGASNPASIHRGDKGDPTHVTQADFGPVQGSFGSVRTVPAKGSVRAGSGERLPNTTGGVAGTVQDRLGALGI